jgi:flavorubredoxin
MTNNTALVNNVHFVGALDWDRRLFDELIPLPDGTSYNAYLIQGSAKTALLDTVDPSMVETLVHNLKALNVMRIDYIISHHAEQDHSGSIPHIIRMFPEAIVLCSEKAKQMLIELLHVDEAKIQCVKDGETLPLGNKTLQFIYTPWVHWPETMMTYLKEDRILFSCDLFGSHLATNMIFGSDDIQTLMGAKRYYAEIMMPFRGAVKHTIELLKKYDITMIAPSHGPIHKKPDIIMNAYQEWISDTVKNEVTILYVSMHGSTKSMVRHLVDALTARGISVNEINLAELDVGKLSIELVDSATILLASPVLLVNAHPKILYAALFIKALRPKTKFFGIIGSYGWDGERMVAGLKEVVSSLKVEHLQTVLVKGAPTDKDFRLLDQLADEIRQKHGTVIKTA